MQKVNTHQIETWQNEKLSTQEIIDKLVTSGHSKVEAEQILSSIQLRNHTKRSGFGFMILGIGGVVGFISCVMSMLIHHSNWNSVFLYGGTTIGVLVALYGMYVIFE
ncbi:MAG: hypothetical protein U0V49_08725 [Saprospiraceae bacterium]